MNKQALIRAYKSFGYDVKSITPDIIDYGDGRRVPILVVTLTNGKTQRMPGRENNYSTDDWIRLYGDAIKGVGDE